MGGIAFKWEESVVYRPVYNEIKHSNKSMLHEYSRDDDGGQMAFWSL